MKICFRSLMVVYNVKLPICWSKSYKSAKLILSMHVYIHIIAWNERDYLPALLESLSNQTYKNFTIRLLDNGSTDGTYEFIQQSCPRNLVVRNNKNLGFAEGHNQLIRFTLDRAPEGEQAAILLANADMLIEPDAIEKMVKSFEKNIGVIQPKIYRAFGENIGDEYLGETVKSDIFDTTGLSVSKSWRMTDRGAGDMDSGQYDSKLDLFGPGGAMFMITMDAVRDVMLDNDFFDSDFFAYREDCDLAWRLQKRKWKTVFVPGAVIYHYRGMYGAEKQTWIQRLKNRKGQNPFFASYSTRNQLFVLIKNLTFVDFILGLPWIILHEGGRVLYAFFFEAQTRKRLLHALVLIPKMHKKRRKILKRQLKPESQIRKYVQ